MTPKVKRLLAKELKAGDTLLVHVTEARSEYQGEHVGQAMVLTLFCDGQLSYKEDDIMEILQ